MRNYIIARFDLCEKTDNIFESFSGVFKGLLFDLSNDDTLIIYSKDDIWRSYFLRDAFLEKTDSEIAQSINGSAKSKLKNDKDIIDMSPYMAVNY